MSELDFYARIEELLGFDEAKFELYKIFLGEISKIDFDGDEALDFGCGSGEFAKLLTQHFSVTCLDKSKEMVEICRSKGLDAKCDDLSNFNGEFDLITASFDVVNYMDSSEVDGFLKSSKNALKNGGYLMFDVNTFFGFDSIAQGVLHQKDFDNHLIVDAIFDGKILKTEFIYFKKDGEIYEKLESSITQYYHNKSKFMEFKGLDLVNVIDLNLYSDEEADKTIFIYKKVSK